MRLFCEFRLQRSSKVFEFANLRSTYIVICVRDNFLSYTAIMLNIVTIQAKRKTSSLQKTLKTLILFLSLAVSDAGGCNNQTPGVASMCDYIKYVFLGLFLECCGHKCWQVLGNSSWSQYRCLIFFFLNEVPGSARYLRSYLVFDWSYWPSLHDSGSHQNLFKLAVHYHKLHVQALQVQKVKWLFADQSFCVA